MSVRVALAQRVSWQRLRAVLRSELNARGVDTAGMRAVLTACDRIPYRTASPPLPTAVELLAGGDDSSLSILLERHLQAASAAEVLARLGETAAREAEHVLAAGAGKGGQLRVRVSTKADRGGLHQVSAVRQYRSDGKRRSRTEARFELTEGRLRWLQQQHVAISGVTVGNDSSTFDQDLFVSLARYDAVAGTKGAGHQAALPPAVYQAFEHAMGCPTGTAIEAFASPFNHRADHPAGAFCTAFPDTDAAFGGASRFDAYVDELVGGSPPGPASPLGPVTTPTNTNAPTHTNAPTLTRAARRAIKFGRAAPAPPAPPAHEQLHRLLVVNPPFGPGDITSAVQSIAALAATEEAAGSRVRTSALLVVPARVSGEPAPHCALIEALPCCVDTMVLAGGSHLFMHGAAFRRTRQPPLQPHRHDSAVYFLSTHGAAAQLSEAVLSAVRAAFVTPHERTAERMIA